MRKVVSFTMIGNECEIIESFVRYNSNFIDKMYFIYDSGTVDNTLEILRKLQGEGYNIVLCDESLISYEQRAIENKYLRIIAEESCDIIIPLDADEFITAQNNRSVITELNNINLNNVYYIGWRNYEPTDKDNLSELFIPKRICYCSDKLSVYTKVIIPANLVKKCGVSVTTGHHSVTSRKKINIINHDNLYLAHFPQISEEQFKSKIYCNSIRYITWMNRADGEGFHINKALAQMELGTENSSCANDYNDKKSDEKDAKLVYLPLNLVECEKIKVKYTDLAKVDFVKNIIRTGQIMAIKAYNLEIDKVESEKLLSVLVFGTGHDSKHLLDGFPTNMINIRAYLDSDKTKEFTMFNRRLVVTPEKFRLFKYDKIIIASSRYYQEMYDTLIDFGVDKELVVGSDFLLDLHIQHLNGYKK